MEQVRDCETVVVEPKPVQMPVVNCLVGREVRKAIAIRRLTDPPRLRQELVDSFFGGGKSGGEIARA